MTSDTTKVDSMTSFKLEKNVSRSNHHDTIHIQSSQYIWYRRKTAQWYASMENDPIMQAPVPSKMQYYILHWSTGHAYEMYDKYCHKPKQGEFQDKQWKGELTQTKPKTNFTINQKMVPEGNMFSEGMLVCWRRCIPHLPPCMCWT